jgi:hypothetical protein
VVSQAVRHITVQIDGKGAAQRTRVPLEQHAVRFAAKVQHPLREPCVRQERVVARDALMERLPLMRCAL